MSGKEKCRILRQIRQQIAQENDIGLITEECGFKGECMGTCPRCEAEVRYLEEQLEKRTRLRKKIALAGISAGLAIAMTGCSAIEKAIDNAFGRTTGALIVPTNEVSLPLPDGMDSAEVLNGDIAPIDEIDDSGEGVIELGT